MPVLWMVASTTLHAGPAADSLFPCPGILEPNVAFWKKIYTHHPSSEGLIHDEEDVSLVYEVMSVSGLSRRSKKRAYRKRIRHYRILLDRVVRGDTAAGPAKELIGRHPRIAATKDVYGLKRNMRFQSGQKDKYLAGLKRSGGYLKRIREIFKSKGLPGRLVYLPHVESSFNYRAYSHRGAAGMWQFMRSTGRLFLRVDYLVDQRLDPIASSEAAAKLLKRNHERLGTWPLALTAYNHGVNGVKRAVKKIGSTDIGRIVSEYKGRRFRFASRNFYAEFLAASEIAIDYKSYFGEVEFHAPRSHKEIVLDRYYTPKSICKALGISMETLKEYNLSLRPPVFRGARRIPKKFRLKVPVSVKMDTKAALAAISDSAASEKEAPPAYYRIRRGDAISLIAEDFGVPVRELLYANGLSWRSRIYAGQVLVIPPVSGKKPQKRERPKAVKKPQKLPQKPVAVRRERSRPADAMEEELDTTAVASLVPHPPELHEGTPDKTQRLRNVRAGSSKLAEAIFEPAEESEEPTFVFNEAIYNLGMEIEPGGKYGTIRVALDETLSHFSDWSLVSYRTILRLSGRRTRRTGIWVGQKLRVPFTKRSAEEFNRLRLEYHMAIEEDFYQIFRVRQTEPYRVRRGDNIWDIVNAENGPPLWLIKKLNPETDLAKLMPGQEILLPVIEPVEEKG